MSLEEARLTIHQYKNRRRYQARQFDVSGALVRNENSSIKSEVSNAQVTKTWSLESTHSNQNPINNIIYNNTNKNIDKFSAESNFCNLFDRHTDETDKVRTPSTQSSTVFLNKTKNICVDKDTFNPVTLNIKTRDNNKRKQTKIDFKNRNLKLSQFKCKFCTKQFCFWKSCLTHLKFKHFGKLKSTRITQQYRFKKKKTQLNSNLVSVP